MRTWQRSNEKIEQTTGTFFSSPQTPLFRVEIPNMDGTAYQHGSCQAANIFSL